MTALGSLPARISDLRRRPLEHVVWLCPAFAYLYLEYLPGFSFVEKMEMATVAVIATGVVALIVRRPDVGLGVLIVALPFQVATLSLLYRLGMPAGIIRPAGAFKELILVGIIIVALRERRSVDRPFDLVDKLAFAYLALSFAYVLLPTFFAPTAPTDGSIRFDAFRANCGFVILFLAARHARFSAVAVDRLLRLAFRVAIVVAAIGIIEFVFSAGWNTFAVERLEVPRFFNDILDSPRRNPRDLRIYSRIADREFLRVGSVMFNPIIVCFALIPGFAIGCQRVVAGRARQGTVIGLGIIAAGILLTQTRSAILAAMLIGLITVRRDPTRKTIAKARFALILVAGLVVLTPLAISVGLVDRATSAAEGEDPSTDKHQEAFSVAIDQIFEAPAGGGLGTGGGAALRYDVERATIAENYYLQMGIEVGVVGAVLFTALTLALIRALSGRRTPVTGLLVPGLHSAAVGLAVAALLLHVWNSLPTSWTFWGLAGAALGAGAFPTADRSRPDLIDSLSR